MIEAMVIDLLVRGGQTLRFALFNHPTRGQLILVTSDLSASASDLLKVYGLRFKIEVAFKSLIHTIGGFTYRFWMADMKKTRRGDGTKYLHRESREYRSRFLKKLRCYNIYIQLALIAQGVL